jgi:hypothetical protein
MAAAKAVLRGTIAARRRNHAALLRDLLGPVALADGIVGVWRATRRHRRLRPRLAAWLPLAADLFRVLGSAARATRARPDA